MTSLVDKTRVKVVAGHPPGVTLNTCSLNRVGGTLTSSKVSILMLQGKKLHRAMQWSPKKASATLAETKILHGPHATVQQHG